MYLSRGQRIKLTDICGSQQFKIKILAENNNNIEYDISCFGLDENGKCSDDRYMIFYNQKESPCKSIYFLPLESNTQTFIIDLSKLPQKIKKLVFTMTSEGDSTMSELKQGSLSLYENDNLKGGYNFNGSDFDKEKSIMVGEIYFKEVWRFTAIGSGFNGGLSSLLKHFGIEEETNLPEQSVNNNTNHNNNPDLPPQPNPSEKKNLSGFFKTILSAPFKYHEKKKTEIKELNEKKARELQEYNERIEKENKFKGLLIDFLSDGILTSDEMGSLNSFCKQNNLDLQDCLLKSQWEIESFLHGMLSNIVSDNIITAEEEATIKSVCDFLNPSDKIKDEIDETIKRVKLIEKISSGEIPSRTDHNIMTTANEFVWHCQPNVRLVQKLKNDIKYHEGEIFVTSERVFFMSHDKPLEIPLKNIVRFKANGANFSILGKTSKANAVFRLNDSDILEAYISQALNKFHRKLDFSQTANSTRHIPQSVRQEVWVRDRGQCVQCQARQYLEYDHMIPFSLGGSNSAQNIQLLCRKCNLNKRDRI